MIATATKIEDLTLNIIEEIHVRAPLEVTFAAERPGLAPGKARLPEPARKMTRRMLRSCAATPTRSRSSSLAMIPECIAS